MKLFVTVKEAPEIKEEAYRCQTGMDEYDDDRWAGFLLRRFGIELPLPDMTSYEMVVRWGAKEIPADERFGA